MRAAVIAVLVPGVLVLLLSGIALVLPNVEELMKNPGPHGLSELIYAFASMSQNNGSTFDDKEKAIALWAYKNGQPAGHGTDNLPAGKGYYIPLKTQRTVFGIMAFIFDKPDEALIPENKEIFETMAFLGALALERL